MKILFQVNALVIILVSPLYATTLTMCPQGGVKSGDTWEAVERKCGKARATSMSSFESEKKRHSIKTKKLSLSTTRLFSVKF